MNARPEVLLVPVDGSAGADAAASYAAALADPLGLPIKLLFAFPKDTLEALGLPPESASAEQLQSYAPGGFAAMREKCAEDVFSRARRAIGDRPVEVSEEVLTGDPATAILEVEENTANPMIVMGRRGLSRFSEVLVGSVSHRIIHQANCPVTIVTARGHRTSARL